MADLDQKSQAQSPERTDTGIYAGVEKYTKEDNPQDNVAYDPATGQQTGAGVPPTTGELSHRSETNGKETIGHESTAGSRDGPEKRTPLQDPRDDETLRRVVVLAPAPSIDHLIQNYPHVFPQLEKKAAAQEAKKNEKEAAISSDSNSSEEEFIDGKNNSGALEEKKHRNQHKKSHDKDHHSHQDGHHHRGPVKALVHVLHLDRHDRKIEKEEKQAEIEELKKSLAERQSRPAEPSLSQLTQTDEIRFDLSPPDKNADPSQDEAVSDAETIHTAIPLEMLNPEGYERKLKEDKVLESGGNLEDLAWKTDEQVKIPGDRIDMLIRLEHARIEAGLPLADPEKDLKVAFHTADSFERLDQLKS